MNVPEYSLQAHLLLNKDAIIRFLRVRMRGETDEVEEIRVTVHDLRGSHLVWAGWSLIMLGGLAALLSSSPVTPEEEE